jgi:hypothetical protein
LIYGKSFSLASQINAEDGTVLILATPRRLITFGVIKGLIYRVYKYPMLVNLTTSASVSVETLPSNAINQNTGGPIDSQLLSFLDGNHHYDEICTELRCSPKELDEQLGYTTDVDNSLKQSAGLDTNEAGDTVSVDSRAVMGDSVNNTNGSMDLWAVRFIFR